MRGPELFVGYTDPAATHGAFVDGGWFRTGDRGTLDGDGWLTITGRIKDVIIRGGENIAAAEVEAVCEAHPGYAMPSPSASPTNGSASGWRCSSSSTAAPTFDLDECRRWFTERGIAGSRPRSASRWSTRCPRSPPANPTATPSAAASPLVSGG